MDTSIHTEPLSAKSHPRWLARWSSAILLAVIVILGLSLAKTGRRAIALRSELKALRGFAGHLDIKDPSRIYAVRILTNDPFEWAWRIYLPPSPALNLHEWKGRMPADGLPHDATWRKLRGTDYQGTIGSTNPGEFQFRIRLEQQASGEWKIKTRGRHGGGWSQFVYRTDWLEGRNWSELTEVPIGQQCEFPAEGVVTLLRLRNELASEESNSPGVTDTIHVFIADTKTMPP